MASTMNWDTHRSQNIGYPANSLPQALGHNTCEKKKSKRVCTLVCWSWFSVIMSASAVIFLCIVGAILASGSWLVEVKAHLRRERAVSSFFAAGVYGIVLASSVAYLIYSKRKKRGRRSAESQVASSLSGEQTSPGGLSDDGAHGKYLGRLSSKQKIPQPGDL